MSKLAGLMGVSEKTVQTYLDKGMPGAKGAYNVDDCLEWQAAYRATSGAGRGGVAVTDAALSRRKKKEEIRKLREETRAKRLKNAVLERQLYPAAEVEQYLATNAERVKSRLEQFPSEAVIGIPPEYRDTVRQSLETAVFDLLTELSEAAFEPTGELEDEE